MKPSVFGSGSELFEAIAQSRPLDCVLLELQMPGMSGLEVMEELTRKGVRTPSYFSLPTTGRACATNVLPQAQLHICANR